jgi:hypothetical protein
VLSHELADQVLYRCCSLSRLGHFKKTNSV